jgi:hypothetical protein
MRNYLESKLTHIEKESGKKKRIDTSATKGVKKRHNFFLTQFPWKNELTSIVCGDAKCGMGGQRVSQLKKMYKRTKKRVRFLLVKYCLPVM